MPTSPLAALGIERPLVGAPMAGGPTSPELLRALAASGALPVLAGGYLSPETFAERLSAVRDAVPVLGVNLFVPSEDPPGPDERAAVRRYATRLRAEADALGTELGTVPESDDDGWPGKLALLREHPVPLVTTTFAPPPARDVAALRRLGTQVWITVTTPEEAREATERGADALIVQGPRAGGHSGTWDPRREIGDSPTTDVLRAVRPHTALPLLAAGGVDGPEAAAGMLTAGAAAVAVGTLLLRTEEAGTSAVHRAALADPERTGTVMTRAYTGRPARALRSAFTERHGDAAPTAYPAVHHLTRPLRTRAAALGDADRVHLWAGTGYRAARAVPAADVVRTLTDAL